MKEFSVGKGFSLCFGKVVNVPEDFDSDRIVSVKLVNQQTPVECTILDIAGHWEGDGVSFAPRQGSICLVATAYGYDHPVIIGYVNIRRSDGKMGKENDDTDYPGDYKLKTLAGNFLKLHSSGAITIECTPLCNTLYSPKSNIISQICQIYEIQSDAGKIRWENFDDNKKSRMKHALYRNIGDTVPVFENVIGYAGEDGEIYTLRFGDNEGSLTSTFNPKMNEKLKIKVKKNGDLNIKWKDSETEVDWSEKDKKLTTKINGEVEEKITKDIKRLIEGKIEEEINKTIKQTIKEQLEIICPKIILGTDGFEPMVLGDKIQAQIDLIVNEVKTHTHPCLWGSTLLPKTSIMNNNDYKSVHKVGRK